MHRIRLAMTPEKRGRSPKLKGFVECDETYVGGKPRPGTGYHKPGRGTAKTPVFGMVERGGSIHRARGYGRERCKTLKGAIKECVDAGATIMTDEWPSYRGIGKGFAGGHLVVNHGPQGIRAWSDASTNTAESSFAILKRGIMGIYHSVSKKHLHRYVNEFDFRWNTRKVSDGDRTLPGDFAGHERQAADYATMKIMKLKFFPILLIIAVSGCRNEAQTNSAIIISTNTITARRENINGDIVAVLNNGIVVQEFTKTPAAYGHNEYGQRIVTAFTKTPSIKLVLINYKDTNAAVGETILEPARRIGTAKYKGDVLELWKKD